MAKEQVMGLIEDLIEPTVRAAKPVTTDGAPPGKASGPVSPSTHEVADASISASAEDPDPTTEE
jgi:hypothetical protein